MLLEGPVCLEPMGDGQTVFRKSCGHDQHWRCVHSRLPFACFVCRAAWTPEDAANANVSPSPIAAARVAEVPMDVMPLCCIRNEFNESSMHFAPPSDSETVLSKTLGSAMYAAMNSSGSNFMRSRHQHTTTITVTSTSGPLLRYTSAFSGDCRRLSASLVLRHGAPPLTQYLAGFLIETAI